MSNIPCIVICPENQAEKLSIVFEAMGRGPSSFTQGRKVCAKSPSATASTPPTHRLIQDMSATSDVEDMWRKMANGEAMPQVVWADVPDITETTAIAAADSMTIYSVAGAMADDLDVEAILDGLDLQLVPEVSI